MKKLHWFSGLVWLGLLLRLTVFRPGCFSHGLCAGRLAWPPFLYLAKLVRVRYWSYFLYLAVGNLIWFFPAGLLTRARGGRLTGALCFGFLLSLTVEVLQFVLGSGVSEVDDLVLNTLGAGMGYGLGCLLIPRPAPEKCPQTPRHTKKNRQ